MADETKEVSVICGPYRGSRLTMPTAEADAAIAAHWARDPYAEEQPDADTDREPPTEEEQTAAVDAATAWAHEQWGREPPPPEGATEPETKATPGARTE